MEENASKFKMSDYYKVLRYLYEAKVDRQEPCNFENLIVKSDKLVVQTIAQDFNGIDYVEVFLNCHGHTIDVSNVSLGFSPIFNGNMSILSVNADNDEISFDEDTLIRFTIDENYNARDDSRLLTGIESLVLSFGEDVSGLEVQKILFKCVDYNYTITDLDLACENGESHVLRGLNDKSTELRNHKKIPEQLQKYVYMAAGAYAWLTRWEYEAKPMKEPQSESNNYADRLFARVDEAINKYLSNIENNRNEEYIQSRLFKVVKSRW